MKQWEVWLAQFPYEENNKILKKRPVIILNVDTLECLSIKVTSQSVRNEDVFDTPIIFWKAAGLKKPSVARVSKTMNLAKSNFSDKLGEVHISDRQVIMQRFMDFINQRNKT